MHTIVRLVGVTLVLPLGRFLFLTNKNKSMEFITNTEGVRVFFSPWIDVDKVYRNKINGELYISEQLEYKLLINWFGIDEGVRLCINASQKHLDRILAKY